MSKILRIHNSAVDTLKGIQKSDLVTISSFQGVADPLSSGGSLAQKPGSSIPSIFARMIFFRMAFGGLQSVEVKPGTNPPVYNMLISQCFDVLEALFNHNTEIEVEEFSFGDQIASLKAGGYDDLYDALEKQHEKFMKGVDIIYLFRQNGQVIGGTSPYSIVFSSPNWNSGLPVVSLHKRPSKFREYVYKLAIAYKSAGFTDQRLDMFINYVEQCRLHDPDSNLKESMNALVGVYTLAQFTNEYPHYKYMSRNANIEREVEILSGQMWLHGRDESSFTSDFFIRASTNVAFDRTRTPLVLSPESHGGMRYYDENPWPTNINYPSEVEVGEGQDEDPRDLPGCTAYRHSFLTSVDFFEQKLIALPYPLNARKFNMPEIKLNEDYYALLPLKPLFFKYFKMSDLMDTNILTIRRSNESLIMELNIPVRNNDDTVRNTVCLRKTYELGDNGDICYLALSTLKTQLNVGIFPFYKVVNKLLNNYWVMLAIDNTSKYKEPTLAFYKEGRPTSLALADGYPKKRGQNLSTWYYQIKDFDYLQVRLPETDDKHPAVSGLVMPRFQEIGNTGSTKYHYAVDFGTTNSHIAYVTNENGVEKAVSFGSKEIAQQAVYLNETVRRDDDVLKEVNDTLRVVKAREFFPQSKGENDISYSFPIRTVTGEQGVIDSSSELFANVSVGFHYPKEVTPNEMYKTRLKWEFIDGRNDAALNRGRLFFTEILWIIKNHWLTLPGIDPNDRTKYPIIMLTFPLGGSGSEQIKKAWEKAYLEVFGINEVPMSEMPQALKESYVSKQIYTMTESLAPCRKLFTSTTVDRVNGILNIDIGGGTTDIQFFQEKFGRKSYYYDSILFAGDDLWGMAYENVAGMTKGEMNNFVKFAQEQLSGNKIKVGNEEKLITQIFLSGKELINFLLRDENGHLTRLLGQSDKPEARTCRLVMFLHYAAIIYHVANWMKVNEMPIPKTINFSGFGSKYINMLFENNKSLTIYTRVLLGKFWGNTADFSNGFNVQFEENPKNVTAEGAALYACDKTANKEIPDTKQRRHFGYDGYTVMDVVDFNDLESKSSMVKAFFDVFIDTFNSINPALDLSDIADATQRVPRLNNDELQQLKIDALNSWTAMANDMSEKYKNANAQLNQSMFIWTLKDSIWKIGLV